MGKDTTIWVKPENQPWQALGVETARGIWAEDVQLTADTGGPSAAQFTLHRDSRRRWPDLAALTPVEVEVAGVRVWAGELKDTPSGSQAISVNCQGPQADLDKDLIRRSYIHNKLTDYKDQRTFLAADLTTFGQSATVNATNGAVLLGWAKGAQVNASQRASVVLDLGLDCSAKKVVIDYEGLVANASHRLFVMLADREVGTGLLVGQYDQSSPAANNTSGQLAVGSTGGRRYVHIWSEYTATGTLSADAMFRIKGVRAFAETSYESGNASILKASTVLRDALTRATTQVVLDFSQISTTSFSIPALAPDGPQTARALCSAVNAYHNWLFKITEQRMPVFSPLPTVPLIKAGAGVSFEPEDSSAGSAEEIYDKVLVSWDTPEGVKGQLTRTSTTSVVARRGQHNAKELQVQSVLPSDGVAAQQIGDTWLAAHITTPFKGSATITGPLEHILTGGRVEPERLLLLTGELILFDGMIDPDTADVGRSGRISQVTYTPADDVAKVTIDDSRSDVDALLARLAAVTGAGS